MKRIQRYLPTSMTSEANILPAASRIAHRGVVRMYTLSPALNTSPFPSARFTAVLKVMKASSQMFDGSKNLKLRRSKAGII